MQAANDNVKTWTVYTLADSRSPDDVRYVGITHDTKKRLAKHKKPQDTDRSYRAIWVRSVIRDGGDIALEVLTSGMGADAVKAKEIEIIAEYRKSGTRLVNGTDGGDGMLNPTPELRLKLSEAVRASMTPEVRAKMSRASLGKKKSPEHAKNVGLGRTGIPCSDETKAKIAVANTGKTKSPETIAKLVASMANPSVREKISLTHRGRKLSSEHIEKVALKNRGKKRTAEVCAKIGDLHRGVKKTPEHALKIAATKRMAGPKSGAYKGITRSGEKWMAIIKRDGKFSYLGTFLTDLEAARAFDAAAFKTWGLECYLNFPNNFTKQEAA